MIITVPEIPWDYTSMWVCGIVWGLMIVVAIVYMIMTLLNGWESGGAVSVWAVAILIGALVFFFGGFGVGAIVYGYDLEAAQIDALEDKGFSNVDLDGSNGFVASYHGDYYEGELIHLGDNSWQVVEILEAP